MIRFSCPTCKRLFQCPDESAGSKIACSCGQRVQIPEPPKPAPTLNKTVLGQLPGEDSGLKTLTSAVTPPIVPSLPEAEIVAEAELESVSSEPERGRRRRRREEDESYDDGEEPRKRKWMRCPFCGFRGRPILRQQVAVAGWIVLGIIAFICVFTAIFICVTVFLTPLCLLGLLIKEDYRICADCGMKLP